MKNQNCPKKVCNRGALKFEENSTDLQCCIIQGAWNFVWGG